MDILITHIFLTTFPASCDYQTTAARLNYSCSLVSGYSLKRLNKVWHVLIFRYVRDENFQRNEVFRDSFASRKVHTTLDLEAPKVHRFIDPTRIPIQKFDK